ncbi:DUF3857 domain-containing protein [Pelagicoccus sp. SDUM812002]|uniref:DUF3857 domain-containing protein n=1 Tax=Pelagicoccus sp. SDUM812002 TaxID=3041266 RepID=UPI0028100596|nr:DUF3857 domain-containing protein [Pelagicoccus sp. SDUM812002]MDQ8187066.1 DUF3857 domain-containing protein [Pelagicoccus sp. SDUM812002]
MRFFNIIVALSVVLAAQCAAKSNYPGWLADSIDQPQLIEKYSEDHDAFALRDESEVEYRGRGQVVEKVRRAFHVYDRDGREYASIGIPLSSGAKLKSFDGWIIYASGKIERLKKSDLVEIAVDRAMLKSDSVLLQLDRSESMREGTVFAYEYEVSRSQVFLQSGWCFHLQIPVGLSRFSATLPSGWKMQSHLFGADFATSRTQGDTYIWEARDLDAVEVEEFQPFRSLITGNLVYSIYPDEKEISRFPYVVFKDWSAVAQHMDKVQSDRIEAGNDLRMKAEELAEGKSSRWDIVSEICTYAQSVNYLAVAIDLNKGGGYRPEDANKTFETHHGDCKDMTALARAMLKAVGIESYSVAAQIGEDSWVHDEWASPHAFNHCILAVPVGENAPELSGIVPHPVHGKLLVFDPTTKNAAPGILPYYLEGRKVLVCSPQDAGLLMLPNYGPDVNRVVRHVDAKIDELGDLSGTLKESNFGANAQILRGLYRNMKRDDFEALIRGWVARGTREAKIEEIECEDSFEENRFDLKVTFVAQRYARFMNKGEMLLFSPVFLSRIQWVPPVEEERKTPYTIAARHLEETLSIELPSGYLLDSFKKPPLLDTEFGSFSLDLEIESEKVEVSRQNSLRYTEVPVSGYGQVVDFYEQVARSESSKVVFRRDG